MPRFKKKPVVIEARQWKGTTACADDIIKWADGAVSTDRAGSEDKLVVYTLEGRVTASIGDWIIKGVKNEFYPCKPDIFAITYERVP